MSKVNLNKLIFNLLKTKPELRDNWLKLIAEIHTIEMNKLEIPKEQYFDRMYQDNCFSNVDTIKRVWAKIQEDVPDLRGLEWKLRQIQGGQYAQSIVEFDSNQLTLYSEEEWNNLLIKN